MIKWVFFVFEEMALKYFRGLSKTEREELLKQLFDSLTEEEKLSVAKILVGKK